MHLNVTHLTAGRQGYGLPFYLTVAYIVFEYGRPQELIPILVPLRLPFLILLSLAVWLLSGRADLRDVQSKLFIALLAMMTVHVPIAVNNFWALQTTKAMLMTFVGYLAIVTFVDSMRKYTLFLNVWMATILYSAIRAILGGGKGIGAFLEDENDAALAINMMIPFAFFLGLQARRTRTMWLWFALAGVLLVADAATLSRGGFVGLAAVGVYCWLRAPRKAMSTVAAVGLVLVMVLFAPQKYWQEVDTIAGEVDNPHGTGQARIYSWKAAGRMFLDHPLLGVGPGNFPWNFQGYEPPEGFAGRLHGGRAAHSLYFTLISELGLAGIIIFSLMLRGTYKDWRQTAKLTGSPSGSAGPAVGSRDDIRTAYHLALALEGSMVAYLVSGVFLSVLYYPHFWVLMGLSVALRRVSERAVAEESPHPVPESVPRMAAIRWGGDLTRGERS